LWQNISFLHPKAGAQFYGQKMLNSIITAVGCATPLQSVEPLLWTPARIGVAIEKDTTGAYPDKNRVVKVSALGNNEAAEAAASSAVASSQQAAQAVSSQQAAAKPAVAPAPKAQGPARSGPAGTAPWHRSK
jgi:hypothetical protein